MGKIIRMDTEQTRQVANQLIRAAGEMEEEISATLRRVKGIPWQGGARDQFVSELSSLSQKILATAEEGRVLGMKVQREVDEWLVAASTLVAVTIASSPGREDMISNGAQTFRERWASISYEDREKWLQDWYSKLCEKYGIPPTNFKVVDLVDPPGMDARGVYNNGTWFGWFRSLKIDSDNVRSDDPISVLNTIAHETRHQFQFHLVEHPNESLGSIPKEQIKSWQENINDYKRPSDDFEAYRHQPIEQDARDTGEKMVNDYLAGGAEGI
jgi:hypothetical protein